jgi:hypothetical protein
MRTLRVRIMTNNDLFISSRCEPLSRRDAGPGHEKAKFVAADTEVDWDPLPPALVLGFGNVSEHQISRGIRTLAEAVRSQPGH